MARMNVLAETLKGLKANIQAVDNLSPVSRVAVLVRAGSRYEPDAVPGISHYARAAAGLTTQNSSVFGTTRHLERAGATLKVTSDREFISYRIECLRDKLGHVVGIIEGNLHKPEFRSWELVDIVRPRLREELSRYKKNQALLMHEAIHKTAFRGGLAHSRFVPEHQIDAINKNDLLDYFHRHYVLDRMSYVSLGVDPNEISNLVEDQFTLNSSQYGGVTGASRYVGGEARIQAGFPQTQVNYVMQGSGYNDLKQVAALEVIGSMLGGTRQRYIKYGQGTPNSLIGLLAASSPAIKTSIVNISHSDNGLFGISITGPNESLRNATKTAVQHMKKVMTQINEADLKTAKQAAKARVLIESENQNLAFDGMARRHAIGLSAHNPLDELDKLTLKDVQSVVGNLLKSKPTLVSIGNPRFVPCVDEMDA